MRQWVNTVYYNFLDAFLATPDYFKISRDLKHIFRVQAARNLIPPTSQSRDLMAITLRSNERLLFVQNIENVLRRLGYITYVGTILYSVAHIDGPVEGCSISIANALPAWGLGY